MVRVFTMDDQSWFARASGDYNPVHIDPQCARRTMFGRPIVHGVHLMVWCLEHLLSSRPDGAIRQLTASFTSAVRVGDNCALEMMSDRHFRLSVAGRRSADIKVDVGNGGRASQTPKYEPDGFEAATPQALSFDDLSGLTKSMDLPPLWPSVAQRFPTLAARLDERRLAGLLALSRIVGMRCPGLWSMLGAIKVRLDSSIPLLAPLRFTVEKTDPRFRMAVISVTGAGIESEVQVFFRPAEVMQIPFEHARKLVQAHEFSGERALIVGGSRGAGEVAAKLIAAGGGDATITYAASRTEAARVVSEIRGGDGAARDIQLDVTAGRKMIGAAITELDDISMLVYCAIPPVLPGKPDTFDHDEFRRHVAVSVEGAYDLVSELVPKMRAGGACIFPSSVYLERPDAGFVEYRAAKAAGEAMWQSLAAAYPTLRFVSPRLPRMRTDQTASIRPMDVADTAEVILSLLRDVREPANPREMGVPDAPRGLP